MNALTRRARHGAWLLTASLLAGCATVPGTPPTHPLADRVVDHHARQIDPDTLFRAASEAQVVYVGEKHDNPFHHARELELLREVVAKGRRPALGLEMVPAVQTSILMDYVRATETAHGHRPPEQRLRESLGWSEAEDWRWRAYGPLLKYAREHGLTVFGADLPVPLRRRIAVVGVEGLNGVERATLPDTPPPDAAYADLMRERIRNAHCGYGSDAYLGRLLDVWSARNEAMARAIDATLSADGEPVLLVVGGAHLRHGLGVPARLARLRPGTRQLNVGLVEIDPSHEQADDYVQETEFAGTRFGADHDYLWFTRPTPKPEPDPCAVFRKRA